LDSAGEPCDCNEEHVYRARREHGAIGYYRVTWRAQADSLESAEEAAEDEGWGVARDDAGTPGSASDPDDDGYLVRVWCPRHATGRRSEALERMTEPRTCSECGRTYDRADTACDHCAVNDGLCDECHSDTHPTEAEVARALGVEDGAAARARDAARTAEMWWTWHDVHASRWSIDQETAEARCAAWVAGGDDGPDAPEDEPWGDEDHIDGQQRRAQERAPIAQWGAAELDAYADGWEAGRLGAETP
jgi:hypothetical protein